MALRDKQRTFAEEYLIDLNATQAAIRAGYSPKAAKQQGSRLLANANIRAYIDRKLAERSRRTGINADRVLRELARVAFVNAADLIDDGSGLIRDEAKADDTAAIASVRVKRIPTEEGDIVEREIKLTDKNKALDMLCRHLGLYADRNAPDGGTGGVVVLPEVREEPASGGREDAGEETAG